MVEPEVPEVAAAKRRRERLRILLRVGISMNSGVLELVIAFLLVYSIFQIVSLAQGLNQDDRALLTNVRGRLRRTSEAWA